MNGRLRYNCCGEWEKTTSDNLALVKKKSDDVKFENQFFGGPVGVSITRS